MKKIVMTGGGTAGHVTPNIALFPELKKIGYEINYIGTEKGMERQLIESEGIPYHYISAGKLRRYWDKENFADMLKIKDGFFQAQSILKKIKPDVVFSKGGFVSCPVVWAAWMQRIPVVIHESDMTPGLANKLSIPFAKKICYTFPETKNHIAGRKGVLTGIPVRKELLSGDKNTGMKLCNFDSNKPIIVVIGGSQGSGILNKIIRENLKELTLKFHICHICGKGNIDETLKNIKGYKQFEYVNEELKNIFAMADIIVSRAGATTLYEILALKKPNLLIPLSKKASRGDQIDNAKSFKKQGFSMVIEEEELDNQKFLRNLDELYKNKDKYINSMALSKTANSVEKVLEVIDNQKRK